MTYPRLVPMRTPAGLHWRATRSILPVNECVAFAGPLHMADKMTVPMRLLTFVCAVTAVAAIGHGAMAQGWGGGGGDYDRYDRYDRGPDRNYERERAPNYPAPVYGQQGYDNQQPAAPRPQNYGSTNPRCRELEFQLTNAVAQNGFNQDQLPRVEADMRQADAQFQRAQADAERADCYEDMFLFGRSLKRSPRCVDLDRQVQAAKARLTQLKVQRDGLQRGSSSPRGRRDEIVAELAHNRCGENYVREYESQRSRSSSIFSFFSDEDSEDSGRYNPSYSSSTYRTMCVRTCDGFYFPITNTAVQSQFQEDESKCRSQCAAPAELYYHRSDQDVDQMVALNGRPYSQMPNAFRNRKVFIRGCSCNQGEYSQEQIAKSEEALRQPPPPSNSKRADASGKTADATPASKVGQQSSAPAAPQPPVAAAPQPTEAAASPR